jgi:hypothetical protein
MGNFTMPITREIYIAFLTIGLQNTGSEFFLFEKSGIGARCSTSLVSRLQKKTQTNKQTYKKTKQTNKKKIQWSATTKQLN